MGVLKWGLWSQPATTRPNQSNEAGVPRPSWSRSLWALARQGCPFPPAPWPLSHKAAVGSSLQRRKSTDSEPSDRLGLAPPFLLEAVARCSLADLALGKDHRGAVQGSGLDYHRDKHEVLYMENRDWSAAETSIRSVAPCFPFHAMWASLLIAICLQVVEYIEEEAWVDQ